VRAVIQRVAQASVEVNEERVAEIEEGLLVLLGVMQGDAEEEALRMADKIVDLRIFRSERAPIDRSLLDVAGELLVVSQFTLAADVRKGRRPEFLRAEKPEAAARLLEVFVSRARERGARVQTGVFGALMRVSLLNDGPVTIILDSETLRLPRGA